jgi:hypothetical protein
VLAKEQFFWIWIESALTQRRMENEHKEGSPSFTEPQNTKEQLAFEDLCDLFCSTHWVGVGCGSSNGGPEAQHPGDLG